MIKYKHGADKNIVWMFLIGIIIVLALGGMIQKQYNLFSTMSEATMTRTVPSSVQPNSNFQITYSTALTGKWGASIVESVSGGCSFPSGSSDYKTVMLSEDGNTKTITLTAPSSGSCTFSGDYKFGSEGIKVFSDQTLVISTGGNGGNGSNGTACATDVKQCPDGSYVSRNPNNNCEFYDCPSGNGGNGEVPSFDLNQVLFKLGDFEVTLLIVLLVGGGFLLLILLKK